MGRLFGTDGIRGIAGDELTALTAYRLGVATAQVLREKGADLPSVLIGMDTRTSGDLFASAIASGLMAGGANAIEIGVTTTPAIAFLVRTQGADAGVMISASHNHAKYNGLKVFGADGYKLSDEDESKIEAIMLGQIPEKTVGHAEIGRRRLDLSANHRYEAHVISILAEYAAEEMVLPRRILFDLSHGSACATAKQIFTPAHIYGFTADFISDAPDGEAINDGCGSTCLSTLSEAVVNGKYDMGFAFDGDADRCLAVDEKGNVIDGDMLIARLARDRKERGKARSDLAIVTVMTNLAFHHYCKKQGIGVVTTDVGDRYVLREMLKTGAGIGGEQSGHIIMPEYATTGDGQVTAAVCLGLLARCPGQRASEIFGEMKPLPQVSRNVRVANADKARVLAHPDLKAEEERVNRVLEGSGRVLIRPSGTEALVRIMLEGKNQEEINRLAGEIAETIERICGVL